MKQTKIKKEIKRGAQKRMGISSDKCKGEISYTKMFFVISHMASMLKVVLLNDQLSTVGLESSEGVLWVFIILA